jgi:hypothetical protein
MHLAHTGLGSRLVGRPDAPGAGLLILKSLHVLTCHVAEPSRPSGAWLLGVRCAGSLGWSAAQSAPRHRQESRSLTNGMPDQSALYGLLARLRAVGIEGVEVRRPLDPLLGQGLHPDRWPRAPLARLAASLSP